MRIAANIDKNHADIATAFRGLGCSVQSLVAVGRGVPDLLVGVPGLPAINLLVEVKAFSEGTVKGGLNDEQTQWHKDWRGQCCVVRSLEDVGRLIGAVRAYCRANLVADEVREG